MELALYHPERGYYLGPTVRSAREGDFLTAAELHPMFGRVLARQLTEAWELLGRPATFTLREYGAGPGTLGLAIFEGLRADGSELSSAITYQPIELNASHRRTLADRFAEAGFADRVAEAGFADRVARTSAPVDRLARARAPTAKLDLEGRPLVGCVLANEFVDALPVHRVEGAADGLNELFVTWRGGWFAEESGAPSTPDLAAYLKRVGIPLAPGQRAEVRLAMGAWLDEVSRDLERGYALVIDYGHLARDLYSPARGSGTLRAYRAHTAHGDPFRAVGRQDLTAHVDFTTLAQWARERHLDPLALTTQARFLMGSGLEALLEAERARPDLGTEAYLALRASIVRLLDPRATGGFRVMLLGRNVPTDRLPSGFREAETAA